jgi:hypothetical protein
MIKIQQKVSGCWRTTVGADRFLALRAYINTTRKQGRDTIESSHDSPNINHGSPPPPDPDPHATT